LLVNRAQVSSPTTSSADVRGRGYTPNGQTPAVRINVRGDGLSVISTVTNKGEMRWKDFAGALNAKEMRGGSEEFQNY